jgi:hypothetical protein
VTAVQLQKNWSINPNVRNTFSTLPDMAGWWIYENHAWLKAHGWTVKLTCNGTAGPASNLDNTDLIVDKTAASTRGNSLTTPLSWTVLTNPDGVDFMIVYYGATDDVIRLSYSVSGAYQIDLVDSRYLPDAPR